MCDDFYKPTSPVALPAQAGTILLGPDEYACKIGKLITQALNWLKENPQKDENVRLKTAYIMRYYGSCVEVEVAAALVADLPSGVSLEGLDPFIVQLAKRYSSHSTAKEIKEENADCSALDYRCYRILAEITCALEMTEFMGSLEDNPKRHKLFGHWKNMVKALKTKGRERILEEKLFWARDQLVTRRRYPQFKVTGPKDVLDAFSKNVCRYLVLDQKRIDDSTLLIGQRYYTYSSLTRLIDGLDAFFKGALTFEQAGENANFDHSVFTGDDYVKRLDKIQDILSNANVINPVAKILMIANFENPEKSNEKLYKLATGKSLKSNWDPDKASNERQALYQTLLRDFSPP